MPELPELTVYAECLTAQLAGQKLECVRLRHPFFLRTAEPPLAEAEGRSLVEVRRLGKQLVFALGDEYSLVTHLMLTGRLFLRPAGAGLPGQVGLAAFDFANATVQVCEYGSHKRAALHVVHGTGNLSAFQAGGLEPVGANQDAFRAALVRENRTLKRALTDQRIIVGIGNTYSDEILHRAKLSPFKQTQQLSDAELAALHLATQEVLEFWTDVIRREAGDSCPEKVTAARPDRAVHGRYKQPCPSCGSLVQRIVYARAECNYCPQCQTGGRLLADRALSRLLKLDWPRTLEELEQMTRRRPGTGRE